MVNNTAMLMMNKVYSSCFSNVILFFNYFIFNQAGSELPKDRGQPGRIGVVLSLHCNEGAYWFHMERKEFWGLRLAIFLSLRPL